MNELMILEKVGASSQFQCVIAHRYGVMATAPWLLEGDTTGSQGVFFISSRGGLVLEGADPVVRAPGEAG